MISREEENLIIDQCRTRIKNAIKKEKFSSFNNNEYYKLLSFIENFEILRHFWTMGLDHKDPKQDISLFSIVYYVLNFKHNEYVWELNEIKGKETDYEQEKMFLIAFEDYRDYILGVLSKEHDISNAFDIFKKHLDHLNQIEFDYFIESKYYDEFANRYLVLFFFTEEFDELDIVAEVEGVSEGMNEYYFNKLREKFDLIELGHIDKLLFFEQKKVELRYFIETTLRKTFSIDMLKILGT